MNKFQHLRCPFSFITLNFDSFSSSWNNAMRLTSQTKATHQAVLVEVVIDTTVT